MCRTVCGGAQGKPCEYWRNQEVELEGDKQLDAWMKKLIDSVPEGKLVSRPCAARSCTRCFARRASLDGRLAPAVSTLSHPERCALCV